MRNNPIRGLGSKMRHIRTSRGFDQTDVAYAMGCTVEELEHIEQGAIEHGSTWIAKMMKWSEHHGISLALLLEGEWTEADKELLFLRRLSDAQESAMFVLERAVPVPSPAVCQAVLKAIRTRFDRYWQEQGRNVLAWREGESFKLSEIDVLQILAEVRESASEN